MVSLKRKICSSGWWLEVSTPSLLEYCVTLLRSSHSGPHWLPSSTKNCIANSGSKSLLPCQWIIASSLLFGGSSMLSIHTFVLFPLTPLCCLCIRSSFPVDPFSMMTPLHSDQTVFSSLICIHSWWFYFWYSVALPSHIFVHFTAEVTCTPC